MSDEDKPNNPEPAQPPPQTPPAQETPFPNPGMEPIEKGLDESGTERRGE
ncbi:MAG: hypothetical protein ACRDNG_06505 [Gaiellaceae bacterium]